MQPYDRQDLAERISFGYQPNLYMALEIGFTRFAGYGYFISPNKDSVHFGFLTMDVLGKIIVLLERFWLFVSAGGAFVYTQLENFSVYLPDVGSYQGAYWVDHLFLRPKVAGGIVIQLTRRCDLCIHIWLL